MTGLQVRDMFSGRRIAENRYKTRLIVSTDLSLPQNPRTNTLEP